MMLTDSEIKYYTRLGLLEVLNPKTHFYHYTKYNIGIDNILIKNTLQFSNPKVFNDPFDCNEKLLKVNFTDADLTKALDNMQLKR